MYINFNFIKIKIIYIYKFNIVLKGIEMLYRNTLF